MYPNEVYKIINALINPVEVGVAFNSRRKPKTGVVINYVDNPSADKLKEDLHSNFGQYDELKILQSINLKILIYMGLTDRQTSYLLMIQTWKNIVRQN